MPLTTLDPKTALVVIDLQKGIVARPTIHPAAEVVKQAASLAAAFRKHKLPVVLVNVDGRAPGRTQAPPPNVAPPPDWTELAPELNAQPSDYRVTKQRWGAFTGTCARRVSQKSRRHADRARGRFDEHRRRIHRALGLRARLQHSLSDRCDDRHGRRGSREQHRAHLPAPRRNGDDRRDHRHARHCKDNGAVEFIRPTKGSSSGDRIG